jgi:hypothetical protein
MIKERIVLTLILCIKIFAVAAVSHLITSGLTSTGLKLLLR